ncbi:MAG: NAD(P)-dependent oxidoreductase [Gammaproteobacteria bacterium]
MRRVLVAGGRGFIGSHAVRRFVAAGYRVHVFGPPMAEDRLADLGAAIVDISGSITDRAAIAAALAAARADLVLSFVAHGEGRQGLLRTGEADAERTLEVNTLGFRQLLEAARATGVRRLLWASSTVVYGSPADYPTPKVDEAAPRRPRSTYGLSKALAEQLAQFYRDAHGLPVTALRLPLVFGPGLWYQGAAAALLKLLDGARPGARHALAADDQPFDLMYVADVAEAFLRLAEHPSALAPIYNLGGFVTTYPDIVAAVQALAPGYDVELRTARAPFVFPLMDASRVERDTGFKPRHGLREALAAYLAAVPPTAA